MNKRMKYNGFTLIELAVVIIIVATLAVVALPQYKRTILKSRYSALLPVAHRIKSAQEAYYVGNGYYSDDLKELDVDIPGSITGGTTANYGEEMTAKISKPEEEEEAYSYVIASKAGMNNNYIMYQEHSKNYPGNIHCEAKEGDSDAQWLCKTGLGGEKIEKGSITPGYTTYILKGSQSDGTFAKECEGEAETEQACSGCGVQTRSASCNDETGEWEYSEWSECPDQPVASKACSELDSKWTSGTARREVQCQGGSWTEAAWDESECEVACEEEEKQATKACACGVQTAGKVTCNKKTGAWEYSEWSECPEKPEEEADCDNGVSGKMTRSSQCEGGSWTEPAWNKSQCCNPNNKPAEEYICHEQNANTCGKKTRSAATCGTNGQWEEDENAWSGSCVEAEETTQACGEGYTNPTAQATRSATCGDNQVWAYGEYDYTACGCTVASQLEESESCSGLNSKWAGGTATRTSQCKNGSWSFEGVGWDESGCCLASTQTITDTNCPDGGTGTRSKTATSCNNGSWDYDSVAWHEECVYDPGEIVCEGNKCSNSSGSINKEFYNKMSSLLDYINDGSSISNYTFIKDNTTICTDSSYTDCIHGNIWVPNCCDGYQIIKDGVTTQYNYNNGVRMWKTRGCGAC